MFYIILKGKVSVWTPVPSDEMARPLYRFRDSDSIWFKTDTPEDHFRFPKKILKVAFAKDKAAAAKAALSLASK